MDCPILNRLKKSPWPLNVPDIAILLETDEVTAAKILELYRQAGRAKLNAPGTGWVFD